MGNTASGQLDDFKNQTFGAMVLLLAPQVDPNVVFKNAQEQNAPDQSDVETSLLPVADGSNVLEAAMSYYGGDRVDLIDKYVLENILNSPENTQQFCSLLFNKLQPRRNATRHTAEMAEIRKANTVTQQPQPQGQRPLSSKHHNREREASVHSNREREASVHSNREREASVHSNREREASVHSNREVSPEERPRRHPFPWNSSRDPRESSTRNHMYHKLQRKMATLDRQIDNEKLALELSQSAGATQNDLNNQDDQEKRSDEANQHQGVNQSHEDDFTVEGEFDGETYDEEQD